MQNTTCDNQRGVVGRTEGRKNDPCHGSYQLLSSIQGSGGTGYPPVSTSRLVILHSPITEPEGRKSSLCPFFLGKRGGRIKKGELSNDIPIL